MSCNSCAKPFGLLRKEKGCPGCGFSYCSKCLDNKKILSNKNCETKVCGKCKRDAMSEKPSEVAPPDAYYKRLEKIQANISSPLMSNQNNSTDDEILKRLKKLKEDRVPPKETTEQEIANRLKNIKGEVSGASDIEIQKRLARLRGVPVVAVQSQPVLPPPDNRTEQEQTDDLLKQYLEQTQIDHKYKDEFDSVIESMAGRLQNLKGQNGETSKGLPDLSKAENQEDEEELIKNVLEKYKREAFLEDAESNAELGLPNQPNDELPFCEICNEDASRRCLGCRYLFCKRCFMEHKDDDDACNIYEDIDRDRPQAV